MGRLSRTTAPLLSTYNRYRYKRGNFEIFASAAFRSPDEMNFPARRIGPTIYQNHRSCHGGRTSGICAYLPGQGRAYLRVDRNLIDTGDRRSCWVTFELAAQFIGRDDNNEHWYRGAAAKRGTAMTVTIIITLVAVIIKSLAGGPLFAIRIRRAVYSKGLLSIRCHVEPTV